MSDKRNQTKKYDVVVVGGGMSGICAALASSRHGAKTALIQARPVLGGNASSEMRMHITGANCHLGKTDLQETGILMEILLENKRRNPYQTFAIWDSVLWEKVRYQENLDLYLNTSMDEAYTEGSKITSILCHQISTETTYHFYADIFVDATGNGSLGMYAGAEFRMGSEGKAEFNEPNAPDEPNSTTMGNTLMFIAEDMGEPVPFKKPDWAYTFTEEDLIFRGHGNMTISHGENGVQELYNADSGYWWIELGGTSHDIIGDHEIITEELYKCVYGIWDHIKNNGDHGAQNYALTWVGSVPGVRESRRLVGDYLLTENDVAGNRIFEDAVAYGGWPMDEHPPHGLFHKGYPVRYINFPGAYTIPYRCYYSKNIDNLMMAGRNISTTKMALGSTRVMGTCAVGGQAVGTAAAMAIKYGCTPRQIGQHMDELQQTLLKDDYAIELMDLTHGKRIFLQEEMNYTHDLNINPYHQENFYYISGRTVYTMSAVNGEVNTAVKHDNLINDYAFTPKYLISVDDSGKFLMTLINRSSDLSLMLSFPRSLKQVVWCNDQIAVAENSKVYIVRRNRDDNEKADYLKGHAEYIERAATSTDGKRLVSCTYDHIRNQGELIIWDLENLKLLASTSVEDQIIQMTFIENANKVFTVSRQGHLSVYDASDLSLLHQTSTNILSPTIFMSPDRSLCLVAGSWRDNRIYRTSDLTRLDMGEILDATSVTAVFSQDNRWLFFADYLGLMMIDLEAKSVVREISYTISDLKLSYNGNYLACLCTDNTVRLMNAQTLEEIRNFSLTDMTIKSVIFDSQDQTLFFISDDYLIRRYRLDNGEFISEEDTKEIEVEEILFSPDNKYYITIGRYESLLWSNEANKPLSRIMSLLAVSPDFDKVMIRKSNDVCIMPFYNTKMLIEEAERKLKGRTLTEQEKKQLFIVD